MSQYSLSKVMEGRNVEGDIYTCDVYRWLKKVPMKECRDIAKKLTEVREKYEDT